MRINNLKIMTRAELKKLWNDKLEFLIPFFGAVFLCFILGFTVYHTPRNIDIAVHIDLFLTSRSFEKENTGQLVRNIDESSYFSVTRIDSVKEGMLLLDRGTSRAFLVLKEGPSGLEEIKVITDVSDLQMHRTIRKELFPLIKTYSTRLKTESLILEGIEVDKAEKIANPARLKTTTNEWRSIDYFDSFASPFVTMIMLGVSIFSSVTAITTERSNGTFERIFVSPYKRSELIFSKSLSRGLIIIAFCFILLLTLKVFFNITLANPLFVFVIAVLIGFNGIALGLLISSITRTELESVALGIASWFIFSALMGFMWPIESMHPYFKIISSLTPYMHGVNSIRNASLIGLNLAQAYQEMLIMCGFIFIQILLSINLLKREIK